jgi:hypothetical protein
MSERHSRQVRLAEIGGDGQGRIGSSAHVVRGRGLAARVEARYLAGAGVRAIDVEDKRVAADVRETDGSVEVRLRDPEVGPRSESDPLWAGELSLPARDVALGAYRALRALRRVVLAPGEPRP